MKKLLSFLLVLGTLLVLAACGSSNSSEEQLAETSGEETASNEVNLYTARHYDVDDELYKKFEEETGIKVNLIKGEADELLERIKREGDATQA
ncbi:hypothetical protein RLK11_05795, partial [Streptococcus pneumoniae]|nr:hypothetical protein [Streptococcus pneumoniae]